MARPASQVIGLAETAFVELCGSGDFEEPPRVMRLDLFDNSLT